MLDNIFSSVLSASGTTLPDFLFCLAAALVLGGLLAWTYTFRSDYTKSFVGTLFMLPAVVCVVIMMVNGSLGAGIAVAGTFSLVRFRSVPGTAREIGAIFLAMAVGLACGMGNLGFAAIFALAMGLFQILFRVSALGEDRQGERKKFLQITVPEDLDYSQVFDDIFSRYTDECRLVRVKTTNLGSLNRLTYQLTLKPYVSEKDMIDELRIRNGNLEISSVMQSMNTGEAVL